MRPTPEHGTRARYLRGCHCQPCTDAHCRYCKGYRTTAYSTGPRRADTGAAIAHCTLLVNLGWTNRQIATAAECSDSAIHRLLRGASPTISPDLNARILRVTPAAPGPARQGYADPTGMMRRGRALIVMGHPLKFLASEIGMDVDRLGQIINGQRTTVRARNAQRMTDLYVRLLRVPGTSERSRILGAKRGWHGPMAWGDSIDDPCALPDAGHIEPALGMRELAQERADEMVLLATAGTPPPEIAARLGVTADYVRTRLRATHPVLYLALTA